MRSVGVGLAFVATTIMMASPALAEDKKTEAKDATAKPAAVASGNVTVHIDSPDAPVALEKRTGTDSWEHVCNSPCDASTSVTDEYRIVGTDLNPSKPFLLDGSSGDKVTLNVTPGKRKSYTTGIYVLGGGAVLGVAGAIIIAAGSTNTPVAGNDGSTTSNKNTNFIFVGTGLILGGVVAAVVGGSMMVDNAHTQVGGAVTTPEKSTDKSKGLSVQVTASRTPTWHEESGPQAARATFVPVLSGTF